MDGVAYDCAFYTVPYPMAHSTGLPVLSGLVGEPGLTRVDLPCISPRQRNELDQIPTNHATLKSGNILQHS